MSIRRSEWINILFFTFLMVMGLLRPLSLRKRLEIVVIGMAGIGLTLVAAYTSQWTVSRVAPVVRDFLPALLMLFVYWQSGRFFVRPNEWIQEFLLQLDEKYLGPVLRREPGKSIPSWLANYLELAYLFCYPLVPLGIVVLYLSGKKYLADDYWSIVLLSTYICYVLLPFIQMLPPRMLNRKSETTHDPDRIRLLNLNILDNLSIQVNTFPSAHVASTTAASLALVGSLPVPGIIFLVISLSIACGARSTTPTPAVTAAPGSACISRRNWPSCMAPRSSS
ncbi:MAG: phosphatase PAP2 family protein, partial [Acidobacteria bacterium]|nr:phosphatase PAP2 family protein [Acidobacteriota bacterium]